MRFKVDILFTVVTVPSAIFLYPSEVVVTGRAS